MAVPVPFHFVPGPAKSADFNTYESCILFQQAPPRCKAFRSAAKSTANSTFVLYDMDAEEYDDTTRPSHDTVTNNSRLVAPEAGLYRVLAQVDWAGNAAASQVAIMLRKNAAGSSVGGTQIANIQQNNVTNGAVDTVIGAAVDVSLAATDYIEMFTFQNVGAARNVVAGAGSTFLSWQWVALS